MLSLRLLPKKFLWMVVAFALMPLAGSHLCLMGLRYQQGIAPASSLRSGQRFSGRSLVQVINSQSQEVSPKFSKLKTLFATAFKPESFRAFTGSPVPGDPHGMETPVSPPACRTPLRI